MKTNKSILLIKSAIIAFVLTTLYSVIPFQAVCAEIPNNVFRFHILANSDTEEDQTLKLKVTRFLKGQKFFLIRQIQSRMPKNL